MANTLYYDELFSNRRSELIDRCIGLQKQGTNFLYILPSREAMKEVRQEILYRNKGIIGSNIIMFDELEKMITKDTVKKESIIDSNCEKVILKTICDAEELKLSYYNNIKQKEGFQNEVRVFIKYLKRNLINEGKLKEIILGIEDSILKKKLTDISLIYVNYNKFLYDNSIYDANDISRLAIDKAKDTRIFNKYNCIAIDGFLNIDKVNQELIKVIVENYNMDIFINCPYKTDFTDDFLTKEIVNVFKDMNFNVDKEPFYKKNNVNMETTEIATKIFTSSKGEGEFKKIKVVEYPSIKSEVIYTAKKIKRLLIDEVPLANIAIYINNKEAYAEHINRVFSEYKIPINMNYDIPLSSYKTSRQLVATLNTLPESFNIKEGVVFIKQYINKVYYILSKSLQQDDVAVANSINDLLNSLSSDFNSMNRLDEDILKEEFINIVKEYLKESNVTLNKGNRAGLTILNTDLAKGIYFDYIFVLGLNEGEVPVVPKSGGLFNEVELRTLKDKSITYKDWKWELDREKIRFILTLASGKKEIILSYRSVNEEGKFAIASQFVDSVKFITQNKFNEKITIRDYVEFPINNTMSVNEIHKSILKGKVQGDFNIVSHHIDSNKLENYKAKGEIEDIRRNKPNFTSYEGIITCDEYISNQDKYISKLWFKDLESYIKCPMSFMFSKIFNIDKYGEKEDEDGINSKYKAIFYKDTLKDYYRQVGCFDRLEETILDNVLEATSNNLILNYEDLDNNSKDIVVLKNNIKAFIIDDITLRNKFKKTKTTILKPFIICQYYSLEIEGITINLNIDRVELEYKVQGDKEIPTGKYIIYTYRNKSGVSITRDSIIKLDTVEPTLIYKAAEEILKEKLSGVKIQCIALLYLGIEKKDRDGIYLNDYSSSIFKRGKTKGCNTDKFTLLMEHGYSYITNIINDMKNGIYNYNVNCNEEKSYRDCKCAYMTLCRHYKSKGEVINNV